MKELDRIHQRETKALSISYDINHLLLDTNHIAEDRWKHLCSMLNQTSSLREQNSIMRSVSTYLDEYIGVIRFVTKSSKLIIGDKACYGERTVIVFGHKIYDLIEGVQFNSPLEYIHFLNAYNVTIAVDPEWSRYVPLDNRREEFNNAQWEALTNGSDISFDELFKLNPNWQDE